MFPSPFAQGTNPLEAFKGWLEEAKATGMAEPTAMTLATSTKDSLPSARIVLLRGVDERGFVFFTNYESRKAGELLANPNAALCFYWMPLERQVRITGRVEKTSAEESDIYYTSRAVISRIGAWASEQSRPLDDYSTLQKRVEEMTAKYGENPPRPPHWGGFRVVPTTIEFWQQKDFRLHERILYTKTATGWNSGLLYP